MYKVCNNIIDEQKTVNVAFSDTMRELARLDERVVYFDCDVINSIGMNSFLKEFPERTINCGIQEANMIGVASGISATGMIPFAHAFGQFAVRRTVDQIYLSAAYSKLNVKIFGSDPGVTAATNGGTHMPIEDVGILRTIPEIAIYNPTDSVMLADIMRQIKDIYGVSYTRVSRKIGKKIFEDGSTFKLNKAAHIRDGSDITIIASGICVADAINAAEILEKEGVSVRIENIFCIKPIDEETIIKASKETKGIVTVENHNILNGLGSAVCEVVTSNTPCVVKRVGVPDCFGEVGTIDYLKDTFKMSVKDIVEACNEILSNQ